MTDRHTMPVADRFRADFSVNSSRMHSRSEHRDQAFSDPDSELFWKSTEGGLIPTHTVDHCMAAHEAGGVRLSTSITLPRNSPIPASTARIVSTGSAWTICFRTAAPRRIARLTGHAARAPGFVAEFSAGDRLLAGRPPIHPSDPLGPLAFWV